MPHLGCIFAAVKLHRILLNGIFHAPLSFYDQTPTGRILSRFSKDIDVLDNEMPELINDLLSCIFEVRFSISQNSISLGMHKPILFFGQKNPSFFVEFSFRIKF